MIAALGSLVALALGAQHPGRHAIPDALEYGAAYRTQAPPAGEASTGGPGRVALFGAAFELDAAAAAELAGDREVVRVFVRGARESDVDPLARTSGDRVTIEIDPADPDAGGLHATAQRLRTARCIELAGGAYLDWFKILTPGGTPSRVGLALREAHTAGAVVLASGAGAPFLGEWAVLDRALSQRPERNPRDATGRWFIKGLGLVRGLLVDSSAVEGGSPDRVVRSAFSADLDRGLYLDGEIAWITEAHSGDAHVLGSGNVLFFDLARARRLRTVLREGRLSLLAHGDRFEARSRTVPTATERLRCAAAELGTSRAVESVLDAGFLRDLLLATSPCGRFVDPTRQLEIEADEASFCAPKRPGRWSARVGLRFDLEWTDGAADVSAGSPK